MDGNASWLMPLSVPALLWEDLGFAALWTLLALLLSRWPRCSLGLTWLAVTYSALNVPIARTFGTPLTWLMVGASGGALSDSIVQYLTAANVIAMAAPLIVGAIALKVPRSRGVTRGLVFAAACLAIAGAALPRPVSMRGLHRNAISALVKTRFRTATHPGAAAVASEGPRLEIAAGGARGFNVLWVVLESTGAKHLKPWGAAIDPMPNLSALAQRGLVFSAASAVYPESIKGLYASLCSRAPFPHQRARVLATGNAPCDSLSEILKAQGYRTVLVHSGWFAYLDMDSVVEKRGFDVLLDAGGLDAAQRTSFGCDEPSAVKRVLAEIDATPGPFFAMYLNIAGHHPYRAPGPEPRPEPFGTGDDRARYHNDLALADASLGTLIDGLRTRGLLEKTVIVVTGDHGEAFGEHEGNVLHTQAVYEENLHVPLLISAPTVVPAGATARITSTLDVAPTILSLLGLPIPVSMTGQNALGGKPGLAEAFTDHGVWAASVREDRWKLIHDYESETDQLFDLQNDPNETIDLEKQHPARVQALSRALGQ